MSRLLDAVHAREHDSGRFDVSTGEQNAPAIAHVLSGDPPTDATTGRHFEAMEEWEIATALRGARRHPLHDAIPPELRPWLLDVVWDRERLWAIARPVSALPISALRWSYDLPWWRDSDDSSFCVTPRDVIERPGAHPAHDARVANAHVEDPLHVLHRHARWMVVEGMHRLVKADLDGESRVAVVPLGRSQLSQIAVRQEPCRA